MSYTLQVSKDHYSGKAYRSPERWNSYYHQLALIDSVGASSVLEIGVGAGVLARELKNRGVNVTTLDVADDLSPDVVGSVTDIPLPDGSFDVCVAFEVLEHIEFKDVAKALSEMARVSEGHVIVSLPHPGWVFSLVFKFPLLKRFEIYAQIPFFWQTHVFNGEHYWELGKRTYSIKRFIRVASENGLELLSVCKYADDPAHRFFVFKRLLA